MRVLPSVRPTPEQLKIMSTVRTGVEVIRGAAGSGKTTTAILRLRFLIGFFLTRRKQMRSELPVRALVLTFNRTLRGYINELITQQAAFEGQVDVTVETFAHWASEALGRPSMVDNKARHAKIIELGSSIIADQDFLCSEIDYILSRYMPEDRATYLTSKREGRGPVPRIDRPLIEKLLRDVIEPYERWKKEAGCDWFDTEVMMAKSKKSLEYDIVVADEVQDFSANQIRAILNHVAKEHAITFVLDGAQRIYARGFTWAEAGVTVTGNNSYRLEVNYRNTKEIAAFAAPLLNGLTQDDDATIPDFQRCTRHGDFPVILKGKYSGQLAAAINYIKKNVDVATDSVAFLHPKGGRWFDATRDGLNRAKLPFVEITRESIWPDGPENIALSTIQSAKGLEFDHVFMLGLNGDLLPHGQEAEDDEWLHLCRLLAMAIGRSKKSIHLGYKPGDADPAWVSVLDPKAFKVLTV